MKTCTKCHKSKHLHEFHKSTKSKDGHKERCKSCKKIEHHLHYVSHKDDYQRNSKKWIKNNPAKWKSLQKIHGINRKGYFKKYRKDNRAKRTAYQKMRMHTNLNYRIASYLRHRMWSALQSSSSNKSNHTLVLLGCKIEEFKKHLESKFQDGMTWNNYGKWHIDHIRPCATFDLSIPREQATCFHYTNMQPLWAKDNLRKWINHSIPSEELNISSLEMVREN